MKYENDSSSTTLEMVADSHQDKLDGEFNALETLQNLAPLTFSSELAEKPASLVRAEARKELKEAREAAIEKDFIEARDRVNPLLDSIGLGHKNTLDNVIQVGEIVKDLRDKYPKVKLEEKLKMVGFHLTEQTARNYRDIAKYKFAIMQDRESLEKAAKKDGLVWAYSCTDALEKARQLKKKAATEKARASGKPIKLTRVKTTLPQAIKVTKAEGRAVLILSGSTADVEAFRSLYAEGGVKDLNEKLLEGSSLVE